MKENVLHLETLFFKVLGMNLDERRSKVELASASFYGLYRNKWEKCPLKKL